MLRNRTSETFKHALGQHCLTNPGYEQVMHGAVLSCAVLCCVVLCCAVLCCAVKECTHGSNQICNGLSVSRCGIETVTGLVVWHTAAPISPCLTTKAWLGGQNRK